VSAEPPAVDEPQALDKYVNDRYDKTIKWYWQASYSNKRNYKATRSLTVILGALVTLMASLASAEFASAVPFWNLVFKLGTPVLAATLTIISGFSQNFQWGATWKDMVMTAQQLQKERDQFEVTKLEKRDLAKEITFLNNLVLEESKGFFDRMLGTAAVAPPDEG
jgi:hypothetical protein